jgi:hypothetical protein
MKLKSMVMVSVNIQQKTTRTYLVKTQNKKCNGCYFKFGVEVYIEESIVNALYGLRIITEILGFHTGGAFSIDSPTPTSTPDLKKHPLRCKRLLDKEKK